MSKAKKPDQVVFDEEQQTYDAAVKPYATNVGAPAIQVEDVTAWKKRNIHKANKQLKTKYLEIDLSEAQSGVVAVIFKYCDDNHLPLLDLKDFKKILQYATQEGKAEFTEAYGRISTASTGAILRKVVELEQQGGELFFGETSFDVDDLLRIDNDGKGYINIIRLTDIQDRSIRRLPGHI